MCYASVQDNCYCPGTSYGDGWFGLRILALVVAVVAMCWLAWLALFEAGPDLPIIYGPPVFEGTWVAKAGQSMSDLLDGLVRATHKRSWPERPEGEPVPVAKARRRGARPSRARNAAAAAAAAAAAPSLVLLVQYPPR